MTKLPTAKPRSAPWAIRHNEALSAPRTGHEKAWAHWVGALRVGRDRGRLIAAGVRAYRAAHLKMFESMVAEDYVLGPYLETVSEDLSPAETATALHGLLNGELGRLDGGTLSGWLIELGAE